MVSAALSNTLYTIDDHALLLVRGPDARTFLQGQVTCDIEQLYAHTDTSTQATSCLGAHCNHKGRMLFSFRAIALDEQTIGLNLPSEMMPIALSALGKYIVFSKAELIDASSDYTLLGVLGRDTLTTLMGNNANLPNATNTVVKAPLGRLVRISDERYELWSSTEEHNTIAPLIDQHSSLGTAAQWQHHNISDGIGEVLPATSEAFTPHLINLQLIANGVSFNKGCYTGQEVVARMHYLGKPKKQMFLFELTTTLPDTPLSTLVGQALYTPEKPCLLYTSPSPRDRG